MSSFFTPPALFLIANASWIGVEAADGTLVVAVAANTEANTEVPTCRLFQCIAKVAATSWPVKSRKKKVALTISGFLTKNGKGKDVSSRSDDNQVTYNPLANNVGKNSESNFVPANLTIVKNQ